MVWNCNEVFLLKSSFYQMLRTFGEAHIIWKRSSSWFWRLLIKSSDLSKPWESPNFIKIWNLASHKEHQTLLIQFFINKSTFWCFLFCFFMLFERFQFLICELQSISRKLLVLSWLSTVYLWFYIYIARFFLLLWYFEISYGQNLM